VWPRWLSDALSGKDSLRRAFWLWGVGVSVAYSLIGALIDVEHPIALTVYLVLGLALGVLQTVILWRCAANSRSMVLARLVRAAVIAGLLIVVLALFALIANPSLLLSPSLRGSGL
jgi:hypothetical protein